MSRTGSPAPGEPGGRNPHLGSSRHRRPSWWWRAPISVLVGSIAIVLITTIAFGATRPNTGNPPPPTDSSNSSRSPLVVPVISPQAQSPAPDLPELDAEIALTEQKYGVVAGVAISQAAFPLRTKQATWQGGTLRGGPAFATIDVLIALAVLADDKQVSNADYLFNKALADDSAAADEALWAFLGTPDEAAQKTTQALRSFGDWRTTVSSESDLSREAPYLQTLWTLESQARVAGAIYCDYVDVHPVLSKLNDPADDPWGLQTIPMTYSKGAWGKTSNSDTLVRQFGLLRLADSTTVGIAMAVSGAADDPSVGKAAITELSNAARRLASGFYSPNC